MVAAPVLVSLSWRSPSPSVSVIVCALAKAVVSKVMVWAVVATSASAMAWRRLSSPADEALASVVVFTTSPPAWVWKVPMSGLGEESSAKLRWSVVGTLVPVAVPLPMAGLPGRRAMVSVGPP